MAVKEIKFYEASCDVCKLKATLKNTQIPPPGWGWRKWTEEGGGHYGLPLDLFELLREHFEEELWCSNCIKNGNFYKKPDYGFNFSFGIYSDDDR